MKYEYIFIDLDDTILDFRKTEYYALGKTLTLYGLEPTEEVRARYSVINRQLWDQLGRQEVTRPFVLLERFRKLLEEYHIQADPEACARCYEHHIATGQHFFMPGAKEALEALSKKYKLYLATNGTVAMQNGKVDYLQIRHYFKDLFISELMGADKPSLRYFAQCFARIPGFDRNKAIMVGDSLNADIQGAKNAGIATCWLNPNRKPATVFPDYQIEYLSQLEALLDKA